MELGTRRLDGRGAIVIGSERLIGRAVALELAREGAKVVAVALAKEKAEVVAKEIVEAGGQALSFGCDCCNREQIDSVVARASDWFGAIDILVNDASPASSEVLLEQYDELEWERSFQQRVRGVLFFTQAVFPFMKDRGGKIINFGSFGGQVGQPGLVAPNAASEAIRAMTRTAAREWGRYGICANIIDPTVLGDVVAYAEGRRAAVRDWALEQIPMGRFGEVDEIARTAVFLASDDSDSITGMTVKVDGGRGMFA